MMTIFHLSKMRRQIVYLLDSNVVSEFRKHSQANRGVQAFLSASARESRQFYLSVITIGELRRDDHDQADFLASWLDNVATNYRNHLLPFTEREAQVWGYLCAPRHQNSHDKQIAATALTHNLCVVTRNISHFKDTGVRLLNPFS